MTDEREYTILQQKFIYWYPLCQTKVEAARKAGYGCPESAAERLVKLDHIQSAMKARLAEVLSKEGTNIDTVVKRYNDWLNVSVFDYFEQDRNGDLHLRDPASLTPEQRLAVQEISLSWNKYGQNIRVKCVDKKGSNDKLGQYLGLFDEGQNDMSPDEYARIFKDAFDEMTNADGVTH